MKWPSKLNSSPFLCFPVKLILKKSEETNGWVTIKKLESVFSTANNESFDIMKLTSFVDMFDSFTVPDAVSLIDSWSKSRDGEFPKLFFLFFYLFLNIFYLFIYFFGILF